MLENYGAAPPRAVTPEDHRNCFEPIEPVACPDISLPYIAVARRGKD
jgi:hypothetical protein